MLGQADAIRIAEQFGVSDHQVQRDHLISLVLTVISNTLADEVIFFGGTALARTHLVDGRPSEDVDLIAVADRKATADELHRVLPRSLLRDVGRLEWTSTLSNVRDVEPATIATSSGTSLRIQLLSRTG